MTYADAMDAVVEANKLGAKGLQVVGIVDVPSATATKPYMLLLGFPPPMSGSDTAWYDK